MDALEFETRSDVVRCWSGAAELELELPPPPPPPVELDAAAPAPPAPLLAAAALPPAADAAAEEDAAAYDVIWSIDMRVSKCCKITGQQVRHI